MSEPMTSKLALKSFVAALLVTTPMAGAHAKASGAIKKEVAAGVDARAKLVQEMVDAVFSFQVPGFQEFQTMEYLTAILEKNGFKIEKGVAGIPSAWTATWSNGDGPVVALGSDVDGLLGLSQVPGVPQIKPIIPGAPAHGEGHNAGMPLIVAAALATKDVMTKHNIKGKLMLWPGVAEELLATKAYYVRAGLFKDVDVSIFTHVASSFGTSWGDSGNNGMVSVEYNFKGLTSHSAGAPWAGRSALDGVELMNIGWNMRREHLPLTQRSHYVITNGGSQPNIVPGEATVWYYFREQNFDSIRKLFETGNEISEAAAKATGTTVTRRILGYAAANHANPPLAEAPQAMYLTHYGRVQQVGTLAAELIEQIDAMATIGRQCDGRPDRHRCLLAALQALYLERAQAHGCALDQAAVAEVLAMDIELNAQGLACWLDRVRR